MNPMMAAIKKRKAGGQAVMGDHQDMSHYSEHAEDKSADQKDLHGFVSSLSDDEKSKLKSLLDKDASSEIQKGGPSTNEKSLIQSAIKQEDQSNALEQQDLEDRHPDAGVSEEQSDEIGKSMLERKHMSGDVGKPRNLGERARMAIANKLKAKGKI